jgi:hypothetical protein
MSSTTCRSKATSDLGSKIRKIKDTEFKKQRLEKKSKKLCKETRLAKVERAKREGTYKSGMEMASSSDDDTLTDKPPPRAPRNKRDPKICRFCGKKGHLTNRSKKCLNYTDNLQAAAVNDLADAMRMMMLPLAEDPPSDFDEEVQEVLGSAGPWRDGVTYNDDGGGTI